MERFFCGIRTRRTITTDELVEQMFSWIEKSKSYVDKVRELAEELEPSIMNKARNKQQQAKKKLEKLIKEANNKDKESKKNLENIKELLQALKKRKQKEMKKENEMKKMKEEEKEKNEVDRRVMCEVLRAMVRRSRPDMDPELTQCLEEFMDEDLTDVFYGGLTDSFIKRLLTSLSVILAFFGFIFSGTKSELLFDEGVDRVDGLAKGGAVGIVYSLPDGIYNQTDLMKKDYVTGARISLRDTADGIEEMTKTVREHLDGMKRSLDETPLSPPERKKSSVKSEDENANSGTIKVGLLNVRSLNNKAERIKDLIEQNNLDVFLTTETWLQPDNAEKLLHDASPSGLSPDSPPKFKFFHQERGGQVISEALKHTHELEEKKTKTFECVAEELKRGEWLEPVLFSNVYRPPGLTKAELEAFLREFKGLLDELSVGYNSIIITGDFNIHVNDKTEPTTRMFEEFLEENNLTQHVKGATHQKGHTLDLVITRNIRISDLRVRSDIEISDHYPVTFKARPVLRNEEHEVQTMVMLNIGSEDIKTSSIPKLMEDKSLDVFFATQSEKEDLIKDSRQQYWTCHSVWKQRGGGVAIQYKEDLNGEERTKKNNNPETFEYVAAEMKPDEWKQPVLSINVYRPPGLTKVDYTQHASQSLRDTADGIEEMTKTVREHLGGMKTAEAGAAGPKPEEGRQSEAVGGAAGMVFSLPYGTEGAKKRRDEPGGIPESLREWKKPKSSVKREGEKRTDSVIGQNEDKNVNSVPIMVGLLNVHSLNNKPADIKRLIEQNNLDVFLTTETWLQPDDADTVLRQASTLDLSSGSPPKFNFFHQERGDQGVAVISEALNPTHELKENKPKTFDYVAVELKRDEWVVHVQVADEPKRDCILFVNVYHRPDLEKLDDFLEEFESFLNEVHGKYESVIVISDILADIHRFQNSFKNIIRTRSFVHHVTELTLNINDLLITKNVEISELPKDKETKDHYFFKFKARPKDANEEHEVQTMVVLNIGSEDIKPSTIPNLMETKALDVFFATKKERKEEDDKKIEEQYKMYHSVWKKRGGGVAVQYRQDLHGERRRTNRNPKTFEYVAAEIQHAEWIQPVLFINVYRPPGLTKVKIEAFLREFKKLLDELSVGCNDSIIITGDFNIHVNVETETTTTMFEKFLVENNLTQHVKGPTHREGHTLDLVIIKNVRISDPTVWRDISDISHISDHYPVIFNARPVLEDAKKKTKEKDKEEEKDDKDR